MKRGFSLIELVFAIVIIAISISALPKVVEQTQRLNEMALKQETVLNAKTMTSSVLSAPWDSNNVLSACLAAGNTNCYGAKLPIVSIGGSVIGTDRPGSLKGDSGNFQARDSARISSSEYSGTAYYNPTTKSDFGASKNTNLPDGYNFGDVDDYDSANFNITPSITAGPVIDGSGDFLSETNIQVYVDYINDARMIQTNNPRTAQTINIDFPIMPTNQNNVSPGTDPNIVGLGTASNLKRVAIVARDVLSDNTLSDEYIILYSFIPNTGSSTLGDKKESWAKASASAPDDDDDD